MKGTFSRFATRGNLGRPRVPSIPLPPPFRISFTDLSATPFHPSRPESLIFLSPVRVYEYLIWQTGRTYSVNEVPRLSCSDLDKENGSMHRSPFKNM